MSKIVPATISEFSTLRQKVGLTCQEAADKYGVSSRTVYRWENGQIQPKAFIMKDLKEMTRNSGTILRPAEERFTFIDLFAGIGGFRKAFDSVNGQCVFTSEWDKSCRITYQANNICDHEVAGDIREFTKDQESLDKIPNHDLLVAGFPCQPFSIAGVSKKNALGRAHGFKCETQGTLFFDVAQIIEHHRPAAFLLENVKNLLSHDGGKTFEYIYGTLTQDLKYNVKYKVINSKYWVPQHRERIFIVGFREDVGFDFEKFQLPGLSNAPKLNSILHKPKLEENESPYTIDGQVNEKYTLSQNLWNYLKKYKEKHTLKGNGFGFGLFNGDDISRTLSARYYKDGSEILIQQSRKRPRRLTPRECSRLMGFDLPNESNFKIEVSDTQAYRQFGNSVVVPVAKAVAEYMKPYLLEVLRRQTPQIRMPFEEKIMQRRKAI
jgi:DNA (cytosine-5)-methyltransferase 1